MNLLWYASFWLNSCIRVVRGHATSFEVQMSALTWFLLFRYKRYLTWGFLRSLGHLLGPLFLIHNVRIAVL